MAVNPIVARENATNTALVTDVLPVMHGSLSEAVKQKRDLCRITPNEIPKSR
jgi:hypothetical protein